MIASDIPRALAVDLAGGCVGEASVALCVAATAVVETVRRSGAASVDGFDGIAVGDTAEGCSVENTMRPRIALRLSTKSKVALGLASVVVDEAGRVVLSAVGEIGVP